MINTRDIAIFWKKCFPECPPVAHFLRGIFPLRWVRFHSLPDSQRYPNDESEMLIILNRHNLILNELATPGEELILLSSGYSKTSKPVPSDLAKWNLFPESSHFESVAMHEIEPEDYGPSPTYWHIFQCALVWHPGVLDAVLRLVANDKIGNIIICSIDGRWLYHPYDGGVDVILPTESQRDIIKQRHRDWLSNATSGL